MPPISHKLHRALRWEYWPMWALYLPMVPVYLWLVVRTGSWGFYRWANPCFPLGGMGLLSKGDLEKHLPEGILPKTYSVDDIREGRVSFPCFVKPEFGCRGRGVQLVKDEASLKALLHTATEPMAVQEWLREQEEYALFYVRMPGEASGRITGVTRKLPVIVKGDGKRSIAQLLARIPRYSDKLEVIAKTALVRLDEVPPSGVEVVVSRVGNHSKGATFLDVSDELSTAMRDALCAVADAMDGFYYGRFDLKVASTEDFKAGGRWRIIEVNGANSEPTHMYDPRHSYFFALREVARHWWMAANIALQQKRVSSATPGFRETVALLREVV